MLKNNCHRMAVLANTAYMSKKEGTEKYKSLGYGSVKFISIDGAQCYIIVNKEEMVICFRGTEPSEVSDIKADLNALPKKSKVSGYVHKGFYDEIEKVWESVMAIVKTNQKNKNLFITGHSLGAAMATIAASRLGVKVSALYTYGSPRAGTKHFINTIQCSHFRHVNNNDIVTKVPPAFMGYRHHGTLVYINYHGEIRKMTTWQRIKDTWRGRWRAFEKGHPFDGAYDHSMENYVECTEKNHGVD